MGLGKKIISLFKEEEIEVNDFSAMLGLNKSLEFPLTKKTVKDKTDFDFLAQDARFDLEKFLGMRGMKFKELDPDLRNRVYGTIGSMTVYADTSGNVSVKFHKRDEDRLWDGYSKKYPEKNLASTAKFIYEIFFFLDDEDDDD